MRCEMRCEICKKPILEDTDGNKRYCQGHSYFETQLFTQRKRAIRQSLKAKEEREMSEKYDHPVGTALLLKEGVSESRAHWKFYHLNPPLEETEFVRVSAAVVIFSGPETYIFKADEEGKVIDWLELPGSFKGDLDHREALKNAGYDEHSI